MINKDLILNHFEFMSHCYNPEIMGKDITIRFRISDENAPDSPVCFYFITENRICRMFPGEPETCDLSVEMPFSLWNRIRSKKIGKPAILLEIIRKDRIRLSGDVRIFLRLASIFGGSLRDHLHAPDDPEYKHHEIKKTAGWEIPKKIVILSGSGRRKENSVSYHLACLFARGMCKADPAPVVDLIHLRDYSFSACRGCFACWRSPWKCALNDDFTTIISKKLFEADLVVISYPVYFYNFPPEIIKVFSRCFANDHANIRWDGKMRGLKHFERRRFGFNTFLIGTGGVFDKSHYETQNTQMKIFAKMHDFTYLGRIMRFSGGSFLVPAGRSLIHEDVEAAFVRAGYELAVRGKVSSRTRNEAEKPVSSPSLLRGAIAGYSKMINKGFKFPVVDFSVEASECDLLNREPERQS